MLQPLTICDGRLPRVNGREKCSDIALDTLYLAGPVGAVALLSQYCHFLLPSYNMSVTRKNVGVLIAFCLLVSDTASSRTWNSAGSGAIAIEEAWTIPEFADRFSSTVPPLGQTSAELTANLLDIHNQRLARMDANGIDFMVLSCANPCVQGIADPDEAAAMAINVNNQLAASISNNTFRFGGFATLAMHDPATAALELKRAVNDLGFLGALVNDYQVSGEGDNVTFLYYDLPQYDTFWQTVVDLDVPVYFHPRSNVPPISTAAYSHAPWLRGAGQEFAVTLSTHVLGLCTNGVFDRFPTLKIIVGHLGERIPSDFSRIEKQLARQTPFGMPMARNVSQYWRTNIFETTSGNFATRLLEFHMEEIGLSQILYSVDYPFVAMEDGQEWLKELTRTLNSRQLKSLKRDVAVKLLKLDVSN